MKFSVILLAIRRNTRCNDFSTSGIMSLLITSKLSLMTLFTASPDIFKWKRNENRHAEDWVSVRSERNNLPRSLSPLNKLCNFRAPFATLMRILSFFICTRSFSGLRVNWRRTFPLQSAGSKHILGLGQLNLRYIRKSFGAYDVIFDGLCVRYQALFFVSNYYVMILALFLLPVFQNIPR